MHTAPRGPLKLEITPVVTVIYMSVSSFPEQCQAARVQIRRSRRGDGRAVRKEGP